MFELTLITPTSQRVINVAWVAIETPRGSLVIQRGHAPMVATLQKYRELRFENEQGVIEAIELVGGIVEVRRSATIVVID